MTRIDFRDIRPWHSDKREGFEELCCQLASLEEVPLGSVFWRKRGAGGDGGVECYWILPNKDEDEHAWQVKYFPDGFGDNQWSQIDKSVKTALNKHPRLVTYTICTNINLDDPRVEGRRSQKDHWNQHLEKWQQWASNLGMKVKFNYWGEFEILERLSRPQPQYAGRTYFWFNQQELTIDWMYQHYEEVRENAGARYTPEIHVDLPEAQLFEGLGRTDAFFDRIDDLYSQLCKTWNKAKPSERLQEKVSNVANSLNNLGKEVSFVAAALKKASDREALSSINFNSIATLSEKVGRYEYFTEIRQTNTPTDHSIQELLQNVRHHISKVQEVAWEIYSFANSEVAEVSNQGALLITGEAGTGKTHLFCDVAKRRLDNSLPTIILLGQHFYKGDLWTQIMQQLHLSCRNRDEFLGALDAAAQACGRRALILIDALNESDDKRLWKNELAGILRVLREYPRISLAVSCRTSYERTTLPNGLVPEKLVKVEHRGFANHEYIATKTFFDYYGIERPNVPLLVPEFSNPLFLKTLCKGLSKGLNNKSSNKQKLTRIPKGLKGITVVFNFFIDYINDILLERLDYDDKSNLVRKAVEALACYMAEKGQPWIEREEAKTIVNRFLPPDNRDFSQSLFGNIISEGLLSTDLVYLPLEKGDLEERSIDIVRFPYEKFSDHLIVDHLLKKHLDLDNPEASFDENQPLGRLLDGKWKTWRISGLIEALCVQIPEKTGQELMDLAPWKPLWFLQRAFLESLIWRNPTKVTETTENYLYEILSQEYNEEAVYNLLLTVAVDPEHPFNAKWLHRYLMSIKMPDRDAIWSIYLYYQYERRGAVDRIIEWAWDAEKTHISDEAIELCAVALVWFLTTSHRFVRDRATKALVSMLHPRPRILLRVIEQFLEVDDLYVLERLYAVAYGVAMLSNDAEGVRELAGKVYEWVFENGIPPVHILLRDYARGVIEATAHRGTLSPNVDVKRVRPPYKSSWPLEIPHEEELSKYRERAGVNLYESVMGFGDFSRYIIGTNHNSFRWSSLGIGELTRQEIYHKFIESLTEGQSQAWKRYEIVRSNIELCRSIDAAPQKEYFEQEYTDEELDEILVNEEATFLTTADNKKEIFYASVLPYLENPNNKEHQFDLSVAQCWIMKRVFALGWTIDKLGQIEPSYSFSDGLSERRPHKPERIGKKYQWIAYHQFLAHVADNLKFIGDYGLNNSPQSYDGPWQILARDIDPSLLLRQLPEPEEIGKTVAWWQPVQYVFDDADQQEQIAWIAQQDDCPNPLDFIEVTRPSDETVWLNLEGSWAWTEQAPREEERYESPRRQMQFWLHSYIVHREHTDEIFQWLKDKNFWGEWMPRPGSMLDVFVGEFPWSPSCKDWDEASAWVQYLNREEGDLPHPVVVTTTEYLCEKGTFDCSIDETISALMPSAWLMKNMGLRWSSGRFSFVDSTNEVVAFDPLEEVGPKVFLISKEKVVRFLCENNFELIWIVFGERLLIGGNTREWHGQLEFSGAYRLCDGVLTGEPLNTWYRMPGES